MQFASPLQKNRLHAATLLATSNNMSRKVQTNQCSATPCFLMSQITLFDNLSLAARGTFSFSGRDDNFGRVLSPFQAKSRT